MSGGMRVAVCLAALVFLPSPARCASAAARVPAAAVAQLARAEEAFAALRADAKAQRQRQNFNRVLEGYRKVFEKWPATRQAEEALMRAGALLTLQYRWTGQEGDLNQAQNYYQRLVQGSPKSPLVDDALLAIAFLYLDQFKDPAQAWVRFRDVTLLAPAGDKSAEARRQLKRLARFAAADKPPPAAGTGELSCPAPAKPAAVGGGIRGGSPAVPANAPTVIAAPPATVISMPAPPTIAMPAPAGPLPPKSADASAALTRVRGIRHWSNPEYSRVVIDLDRKTNFYSNLLEDRSGSGKPPRLYIDLFSSVVEERLCRPIVVNDGILSGIRVGQNSADSVRLVLEIEGLGTYRVFPMQNPFRIVVDVTGGTIDAAAIAAPLPAAAEVEDQAAAADPESRVPDASAVKNTPSGSSTAPAPDAPPTSGAYSSRYQPEPVPELIPLPTIAPEERTTAVASVPPPGASSAATHAPPATFSGVAPAPAPPAAARASTRGARPAVGGARPAAGTARAPAAKSSSGKPSLARQLGLGVRRVVIDAGHGAHDPGAIGVDGIQEKDVTLDLALRVRDILRAAGYETVLTRDRDVYLPLEERTALANTARGDLFLSLHCNASDSGNLSGVETYFLNLASNVRSMQTAARENSMAVANMSDLQQIVREIQNSKMDESSQFAARIQRSLHDALHRKYPDVKDLGVKQAPFYVLIGAQMPSVLAEVSFINNRTEGRRLADPAYRQLIAQALVDGVKRYVRTVKTAALTISGRSTP